MAVASRIRAPQTGEPAPWFTVRSAINPTFHFDTVAGRYVVLCFFGSAGAERVQKVLDWIEQESLRFDDVNLSFFGVSVDPKDELQGRVKDRIPGTRFFWDFDRAVTRLYGLDADGSSNAKVTQTTFVLDEMLRVFAAIPLTSDVERHNSRLSQILERLPLVAAPVTATLQAPVLVLPRIFEPALCRQLIGCFEIGGGKNSGFMRDVDVKTIGLTDYKHKRRRDHSLEDERLKRACMTRIHDRLVPQVERAFQFRATRIERYIVACYDSELRGHFRAHRDNTTKGTAHRRFAVTINLNTNEYEGGHLRFPEYGPQLYEAPVGGAVVFSCSLLHEATVVIKGKRFAFLPVLYDEAAAALRLENRKYLASENEGET